MELDGAGRVIGFRLGRIRWGTATGPTPAPALFASVDAVALERVATSMADAFMSVVEVVSVPLITNDRIGPGAFAAGLAKAHLDGAASAIFARGDAGSDDALIDDVVDYLRSVVATMRETA